MFRSGRRVEGGDLGVGEGWKEGGRVKSGGRMEVGGL